jgi:hypothetical protein
MRPGVVMPAERGRVFFMWRKEGERALRMSTKVWPPKYICVPWVRVSISISSICHYCISVSSMPLFLLRLFIIML